MHQLKYRKINTDEIFMFAEERLKCIETIVNNLNSITGHRHTISKVVHQSDKLVGLPISNVYHKYVGFQLQMNTISGPQLFVNVSTS